MNKGKVIDIQKKYAIVLNDQMAYEKIEKKTGLTLGKELYYFKEDLYKETKQPVKKYFLVAAVLFMMLFIQPLLVAEEAYGYISVDINPSIELEVNKSLEVLSIKAINDDAKSIVKSKWIGESAKDVIQLIIEETKSKGILNSERDFVLVSYYFDDEELSTDQMFIQSLDELFNEKSHDYEVAVIKSDEKTYSEAKKAKESLGQQVVNNKMNKPVKDLLAVKESIKKDEDFKVYNKDTNGKSEADENDNKSKGVIGRKVAETIAFESIGGIGEILDFDFERDKDEAKYIFEIAYDEKIHEIEIDGFNGKVIEYETKNNNSDKNDNDNENEKSESSKGVIGRKAAEIIAFEKIGKAGKILEFDFERDDDEAEYTFEIESDDKIYKIMIDGFTGEVIDYEVDINQVGDDSDDKKTQSKGVIGRKKAEMFAFERIGEAGNVIEFDFDRSGDKAEYTFEIAANGKTYEIKIDGFTRDIIKFDEANEYSDDKNSQAVKSVIGKKAAKMIAYEIIGNEAKIIDYDFDSDEDEPEYIFEVESSGRIHKIIINGYTGEMIEHEIDEQDEDSQENNNKHSYKDAIDRKTAELIAFEAIGGEGKVIDYDFDSDEEEPKYIFEIDLEGRVHEIEINSFTGEVIKNEMEGKVEAVEEIDKVDPSEDIIDRKTAELIAFEVIGGKGEIVDYDFDSDEEEPEYIFEIALEGKIHEISINGFTSEVIEHEVSHEKNDND